MISLVVEVWTRIFGIRDRSENGRHTGSRQRSKTMKLLLAVLILMGTAQAQQMPKQFDLKGDTLGMTLKNFKARHPQAKCYRDSETLTECEQQEGVSFAGLTLSLEYQGKLNGMTANFFRDKLIKLKYLVNGSTFYTKDGGTPDYKMLVAIFTAKFGRPIGSNQVITDWENISSTLELYQPVDHDNAAEFINVELSLTNDGTKSDI
jgi:hypothetical protein